MSSWVNISNIETILGHKILIAGLQEAGKTAIKRIFFLRQQAVDVKNLKATIDYERMAVKIAGVPITVVDLGGQRIFIKRFLSKFSPFVFNNVKFLIFVIDVSQKSTRNNAIQYFSSCVKKLQEYSNNADVFVFLHKNDLVRQSPNYESIHEQFKEQFQLESTIKIKFFRTTIFDTSTIINTFGRIFELSIPSASKSTFVDHKIIGEGEEFANKFAVLDTKAENCPNCGTLLFDTHEGLKCSVCDYQISKIGMSETNFSDRSSVGSLEELQNQLNDIKIDEKQFNKAEEPTFEEDILKKLHSELGDILVNNEADNSSYEVESNLDKGDLEIIDKGIPNIEFSANYDLTDEESSQLEKIGFADLFKRVLSVGIPSELIRTALLDYLPEIDPAFNKISKTRIYEIFSAYINGIITEDEIFNLLYFSQYFPELTIEELLWQNLTTDDRSSKSQKSNEARFKVEITNENSITLSEEENIGIIITPKGKIVDLTFFKNWRFIDRKTVSFDITENDLRYLFAFEIKFNIELDLKIFTEKSVKIIMEQLSILKPAKQEKKLITQIPCKTSNFKTFSDNQDIDYRISIEDKLIKLEFRKSQKNFGSLVFNLEISASEIFYEVNKKTLLPTFITQDVLMFSVLEIFNQIEGMLR